MRNPHHTTAPGGRHNMDLPPELRPFVAAWRAADDAPPDFAASVAATLRVERAREPATMRARWRHAGAAICAAVLLLACGLMMRPGADRAVELAAAPVPADAAAPAPAPVPPVGSEVAPVAADAEGEFRPRLLAFPLATAERWSPAGWVEPDVLAETWAKFPTPDPDRTWRDELADGVRPYRRGAETAWGLFASAVPPRGR